METLRKWLPDFSVGILEIRDLANLLVAAVFGYYANQLGKRQTLIAEKQDKMMEAEASKKAVLVPSQANQFKQDGEVVTFTVMEVRNVGNRPADGFHWELLLPTNCQPTVAIANTSHEILPTRYLALEQGHYILARGHYQGRLFAGAGAEIAVLHITHHEPALARFKLLWQIRYEDGNTPSQGYGTMDFEHTQNYFYRVSVNASPTDSSKNQ